MYSTLYCMAFSCISGHGALFVSASESLYHQPHTVPIHQAYNHLGLLHLSRCIGVGWSLAVSASSNQANTTDTPHAAVEYPYILAVTGHALAAARPQMMYRLTQLVCIAATMLPTCTRKGQILAHRSQAVAGCHTNTEKITCTKAGDPSFKPVATERQCTHDNKKRNRAKEQTGNGPQDLPQIVCARTRAYLPRANGSARWNLHCPAASAFPTSLA